MKYWQRYLLEVNVILAGGAGICVLDYYVFGVARPMIEDIAVIFMVLAIFFPPIDLLVTRLTSVPRS